MQIGAVLSGVVACAVAAGCQGYGAPVYRVPPPPSEEVRASLGTIGVRCAEGAPMLRLGPPVVVGPGMGALGGLGRGVVMLPLWTIGIAGAGGSGGPFGVIVGAFVGAAWGVIYVPVSAICGGVTAADSDRTARAQAVIDRVLAQADADARFRDAVCEYAERGAAVPAVRLSPGSTDDVDTIVEVAVAEIGRGTTWTLWSVNAAFEVRVTAQLRLVRARDGVELYAATIEYANALEAHTHADWGEGRAGEALRDEIDGAIRALAEQLVEEVFLSHPRPGPTGTSSGSLSRPIGGVRE